MVVPSLLYLQDKGFGVEGGIPTFLIAGAALNDVIGITGFNVVLGMIFSDGKNLLLAFSLVSFGFTVLIQLAVFSVLKL